MWLYGMPKKWARYDNINRLGVCDIFFCDMTELHTKKKKKKTKHVLVAPPAKHAAVRSQRKGKRPSEMDTPQRDRAKELNQRWCRRIVFATRPEGAVLPPAPGKQFWHWEREKKKKKRCFFLCEKIELECCD
jgi:hypothetical protein